VSAGDMAQDDTPINESSPETPDLEVKLKEETRLRQYTEQVLDSRQQELESQESENSRLRKKIESLQKELNESRGQVKTKAKQLQDAKDQIFQLQPHKKDITDSEAHDLYKSLVGNVQRWVENRLKSILDDFEGDRLRTRPAPSLASRLLSLLRESAKRCIMIDQADEYHIMAIIMNYLWHAFFSKSFYCPLDDGDNDGTLSWIDGLESSMSRLPRGKSSDTGKIRAVFSC
jgi:cell division septum initiation protein DivIVA